MNETQIKEVLKNSKTIAMIGVSSEKKGEDKNNLKRKPANVVMKYMQDFGYKVYPINPFAIGETINGETVLGSLDDIEEEIDILDVFRPSREAPNIAKEAIKKKVKVAENILEICKKNEGDKLSSSRILDRLMETLGDEDNFLTED